MVWEEVEAASAENRHELVLSGKEISSRISEHGLDPKIFDLSLLNFLEISHSCLQTIPSEIANLKNLSNLVLRNNKLCELGPSIGTLSKLKMIDLSVNCLERLPKEIKGLTELQSLNVSSNQLQDFPNINTLHKLHILDVSHNMLQSLPEGITDKCLSVLTVINAQGNQITEVPSDFFELPSLKTLYLSDNKLTELPAELSQCLKLKELFFAGNKLNDRRLKKMGEQCQTKSVLDYLSKSVSKKSKKASSTSTNDQGKEISKKDRKKNRKQEQEMEHLNSDIMKVLHFNDDNGVEIQITDSVSGIRPYIVCCVVRNVNFKGGNNLFKKFINLQTKLHDTLCQKRNAATIATHDLSTTKSPLLYDARSPSDITVVPLFGKKDVTAAQLMDKLMEEAEEQRKEKKRNQISGIHKYLDLLKGKSLYPCLVDKEGLVISLPPITNCDATKISENTEGMLIEVTSSTNLEVCKNIMDQLLADMLELGLGGSAEEGDGEGAASSTKRQLQVEQVKILDTEGHMKVVYPSRVDLTSPAYKVIRDYD